MSPLNALTLWRRLRAELLLCQRSSKLSDSCFVAILLLLSIEPTAPVPSRGLLNGGSALHPPKATTTAVRCQEPLLLVVGHVPHGRHLQTTCGRHCSSEHTPRLSFWSHQFPASCVTLTTPQRNCPNSVHQEHAPCLGFESQQFPASWLHGPLHRGTTQASTHQSCSLRAQPACCTAHLRELSAQAPRPPVHLYFFCATGLRHMHHAPLTIVLESTLRGTSHEEFAC